MWEYVGAGCQDSGLSQSTILRFRCRGLLNNFQGRTARSEPLPGPPNVPNLTAPISQNAEYRRYRVHCFGHFGGPSVWCMHRPPVMGLSVDRVLYTHDLVRATHILPACL